MARDCWTSSIDASSDRSSQGLVDLVCCGAINWDINLYVRRMPKTGEEVQVLELQRVPGGTAANVAVAAARILGPQRVSLVAALGDDEIAERQLELLRMESVNTSAITRVHREESGQAYISIGPTGENEIHTYFGANLFLTPESLEASQTLQVVKQGKVTVIMDPPLDTCQRLAELCKEFGNTVTWDPGVLAQSGLKKLSHALSHVDYLVLNKLEYEELLGTSEAEEIASKLSAINPGIKAIVKQGDSGCTLAGPGGRIAYHVKALPLEKLGMRAVNTVGCGDAFIGAFAAAKALGHEDLESLGWGCAAGGYKATRKETRGGPTKQQLETLLKKLQEP